ncbi:amino acid transporter [Coprinopsis sp. MPI-PUGE-AT-0042]|nr:amino acid transporter [Coprinopsis sp. MPI-PUGE-AT-0042]
MASQGTSFSFGSAVSATGSAFSDAFESYRRTQYLVAGSSVAPTSETDEEAEDEETGFRRGPLYDSDDEEVDADSEDGRGGSPQIRRREDSFVANLDWDEEGEGEPSHPQISVSPFSRPHLSSRRYDTQNTIQPTVRRPAELVKPPIRELRGNESSPLLSRKTSSIQAPLSFEEPAAKGYGTQAQDPNLLSPPQVPILRRRSSAASHKSKLQQYSFGGRSTYGQSLFNSIAILLGIGMLSEPLAFAYAGWGMGTVLIITYAMISCYTAKILARVILSDPRLRSYADIGRKAFGPKATVFISAMFCLELFAVTVVLVTLYADSLHSLVPKYSQDTYKLMGLLIFIPTVFLPLSLLSYTSILGIFSTVILVFVIFIDGFSKKTAPGSLWEPAPTSFGVKSFNKLGLAFGLFMAGFSGHPVIPSLARDMVDPSQFDHMINWAFTIATFIYTAIGAAGYLMFGDKVHDEVQVWAQHPTIDDDHRRLPGT